MSGKQISLIRSPDFILTVTAPITTQKPLKARTIYLLTSLCHTANLQYHYPLLSDSITFLKVSLSTTPLFLSLTIINGGTSVILPSVLAYSSTCNLIVLYFLEINAFLNSTSSNSKSLASSISTSISPMFLSYWKNAS